MLKLAYQYIQYYKSQTFAILASIILTSALLSGMSSLIYSNTCNELEHEKAIYGNWHYSIHTKADFPFISDNKSQVMQYGKMEIVDILEKPYRIYFIKTDQNYREMTNRKLIEGKYPKKSNEIAMDRYTLGNLGFSAHLGNSINLNKKNYILTGIIESAWSGNTNKMELFVGEDYIGKIKDTFYYLQFDERKTLYKQLDTFLKVSGLSGDTVTRNDEVTSYLGGEKPDSIYNIIKFAITDKHGNFTYIILKLQSDYHLFFYGMILLLYFFSLFVIYSIFNISISKRISEYGIMQTLGISETCITITLVLELWLLFLLGYPLGCLVGNGILTIFYQKLNGIFSIKTASIKQAIKDNKALEFSFNEQTLAQKNTETVMFHINWNAIIIGFFFLLIALTIIAFLVVYSMRKQSIHQAILGDNSLINNKFFTKKAKRKIYSKYNFSLANIVVKKFLFSNKKRAMTIILSLSIGGCIFLCTTYMVENLKIHVKMSMKSEDGLGSDYKISLKSRKLNDTIPEKVVNAIKEIPELSEVYATKYILAELLIQEEELEWKEYFDERNKDYYFQQYFNGICVKRKNGTYGIKYDIYGYESEMLNQLQDFLLEGTIIEKDLKNENKIIAVANVDGQGNYNFYGKHPGDMVTLRVPKDLDCSFDVFKFQSQKEYYIEKEFEIAAIVSRTFTQEDNFLAVEPYNQAPSFILAKQQMDKQYRISGYKILNISSYKKNKDTISNSLLYSIRDIPKAILQDYTTEIKAQKNYLQQQEILFSGIAIILLIISLFHIMNSMNYSILSHRREYGIIRAMGITNIGFYIMILKAGLFYGLLTDGFIFLFYHLILRQGMNYYMSHIVQFLHISAEIPNKIMIMIMILNIFISLIAVFIPAKQLIKSNIIRDIAG